jgi:hypothetical protein
MFLIKFYLDNNQDFIIKKMFNILVQLYLKKV